MKDWGGGQVMAIGDLVSECTFQTHPAGKLAQTVGDESLLDDVRIQVDFNISLLWYVHPRSTM